MATVTSGESLTSGSNRMIVTVSGAPGTGTSTLAKILAESLDAKLITTGDTFRAIASDMKLSIQELLDYAEEQTDVHKVLDERIQRAAEVEEFAIVEGRTVGFLIPADLHIHLTLPFITRVSRIAKREGKDDDIAHKETVERMLSEQRTFKEIYGFDIENDTWPYDIIIDTGTFDIAATVIISKLAIIARKRDLE